VIPANGRLSTHNSQSGSGQTNVCFRRFSSLLAGWRNEGRQPLAVARFDPHAGIQRETGTVIPGAHCRGVFALEHCAAGENAQQTAAHLGLNLGDGFGTDAPGFMNAHAACAIGLENPLDHNAVKTKRSGVSVQAHAAQAA